MSRSNNWPLRNIVIVVALTAVAMVAFIVWSRQFDWSGFGESKEITTVEEMPIESTPETQTISSAKVSSQPIAITKKATNETKTTLIKPSKTLWDWIVLLLGPATLAGLGFAFQYYQEKARSDKADADGKARSAKEAADERVRLAKEDADKERNADQQREQALQIYFNQLSELLVDKQLNKLLNPLHVQEEIAIETKIDTQSALPLVKARTLALLRMFDKDGSRSASVLSFLADVQLLPKLELAISLTKIRLSGVNLTGVNFRNSILKNGDFSYANLSLADLSDTNLSEANLMGANLSKANLSLADLRKANLYLANLSGANLLGTYLLGVNLGYANLSGANLLGVNLGNSDLNGADLSGADLTGLDLREVNLRGTNLSRTLLCGTNLSGVDLSKANLLGAALDWANLSEANLSGVDMSGMDLSSTKNLTQEQVNSFGRVDVNTKYPAGLTAPPSAP